MVLMYHNLALQACFNTVSIHAFENQIRFLLERGYQFVSAETYARHLDEAKRLKMVCLSFDDGYESFLLHVLPIAKAYDLPIALSIPTDFIGAWNQWDDPSGEARIPILGLEELKALAQEPLVTICSHGCSHRSMASLSRPAFMAELLSSKEILEGILDRPVKGFCFPFGQRKDLPHGHAKMLESAGYEYALSTIWGRKTLPGSRFAIRRIEVCPEDSAETLLNKIQGNPAKWLFRQFARSALWRLFGNSAMRQRGLNTAS